MTLGIRKGNWIEFTDTYHADYTLGDERFARIAVAIEDEDANGAVLVMTAENDAIYLRSWQVQAFAFIPAYDMPKALEDFRAELMGYEDEDFADEFEYPY
jgi:hypothetical protein